MWVCVCVSECVCVMCQTIYTPVSLKIEYVGGGEFVLKHSHYKVKNLSYKLNPGFEEKEITLKPDMFEYSNPKGFQQVNIRNIYC